MAAISCRSAPRDNQRTLHSVDPGENHHMHVATTGGAVESVGMSGGVSLDIVLTQLETAGMMKAVHHLAARLADKIYMLERCHQDRYTVTFCIEEGRMRTHPRPTRHVLLLLVWRYVPLPDLALFSYGSVRSSSSSHYSITLRVHSNALLRGLRCTLHRHNRCGTSLQVGQSVAENKP